MPKSMREWLLTVSGGVATTVIIAFLIFQWDHYAQAEDTTATAKANTEAIKESAKANAEAMTHVVESLQKLTDRAVAEDTAKEQDAMRCRQGIITDKAICNAAGEEVAAP